MRRRGIRSTAFLVVPFALAAAPEAAVAQASPSLDSLARLEPRVRVRLSDAVARQERFRFEPVEYEGRLVAAGRDSLVIVDARGRRASLAVADVGVLERHLGGRSRGTNVLRGVLVGGAIGVVGGAVVGAASFSEDDFFGPGFGAAVGGTLGGGAGILVGGLIGASQPAARWERIPIGGEARVGVVLTPAGRAGVGVSLRF